jgi:hypothetical protein
VLNSAVELGNDVLDPSDTHPFANFVTPTLVGGGMSKRCCAARLAESELLNSPLNPSTDPDKRGFFAGALSKLLSMLVLVSLPEPDDVDACASRNSLSGR